MALGAQAAGVRLVTSYPGSPSSGTVEAIIGLAEKNGIYAEWSSNEKVALEMGIGASIAGKRALVGGVGLNAVDPCNSASSCARRVGHPSRRTPYYSSQNDRFTSYLLNALLEPSGRRGCDVQEARYLRDMEPIIIETGLYAANWERPLSEMTSALLNPGSSFQSSK
jgi:hypothetical protein